MTLRLRLVLALAALVTIGLVVFGVTTYGLYSHSQHQRLDDQLRSSVPLVTGQLRQAAGLAPSNGPAAGPGTPGGGPPVVVPPGTYAELRDRTGAVVSRVQLSTSTSRPDLPATLTGTAAGSVSSTGSATGSGGWRVLVTTPNRIGLAGDTVVVAVPLTEVTRSLHRLVLIESLSGVGLLVLLGLGSWLILRRGLRPLEQMAATAGSISAGALHQRVAPDDGRTEVGQLGLALNTMLGELEEAFREREATEARLRQFLADASHELRTPLTSIQGFAELFRLGPEGREHVDLEVIMRRIEEESQRMHALVDDLVLLARLDQTRPAARDPVDLAMLAADACSDAVAADPDRRVTLDAPAPVVVRGDEHHLRQAIGNLVTNALRHTPAGTPIDVAAHVDGGATVVVRDHGPGLGPEALAHAFDRFWQADEARVGTGAGLGLAIVAAIAEEHGGTVAATDVAPTDHDGGGAAFTLNLPLDPPLGGDVRR